MLLKDWLKKKNYKTYIFADEIGMSRPNLYRILHQTHRVSARFAVKIEEATKGEVSKMEIMWPEDFQKKKPKR